jgi:hemerythrin
MGVGPLLRYGERAFPFPHKQYAGIIHQMAKWDPKYNTGYPDLDLQHQKALRLLTIAGEAVDAKLDIPSIVAIIDETYDYFLRHTNMEEELMETFRYPELFEHRQEHQSMLRELRRISEDYGLYGHRSIITVKLNTMISRWAREHILDLDKKMVAFLLSHLDR